MSQTFQPYLPLSSASCIRLVNIKPAGTDDEPLDCTLEELDLEHSTGYSGFSALSYRWGTEQADQPISLNGATTSIRKNLYDFLLNARRSEWTRNLWIDGLSINQLDLKEKSQQVAKMGEIYSRASHVLVWLGRLSREECKALAEIKQISDDGDWNRMDLNELSYAAKQGLDQLAQNPYWTRKWIIQEILLAGPNVSLVVGPSQIRLVGIAQFTFSAIYQAEGKRRSQWFDDVYKSKYDMQAKMKAKEAATPEMTQFARTASQQREIAWEEWIADNYHSMYCCRNTTGLETLAESLSQASMTHSPRKLSDLVTKYSDFVCQEPLDHIFALLCLASSETRTIPVDYSMDKSNLYWAFLMSNGEELEEQQKDDKMKRMVNTLRSQTRSLQQAMRISRTDALRTLGQLWCDGDVPNLWRLQFVEAIRNCFSTLRVTKQRRLPKKMHPLLAELRTFAIDWADAQPLSPTPAARNILADIFSHVTTIHSSTTRSTKPINHEIGIYDYAVAVVIDTTAHLVTGPSHPLEVVEIGNTTFEIHDNSTIPIALHEMEYTGHETEIQHWLFQHYNPTDTDAVGTPAYPIVEGDILCMFSGHQPALVLRRISDDEVLLGISVRQEQSLDQGLHIVEKRNTISGQLKAFGRQVSQISKSLESRKTICMRPHSVLRLQHWGRTAEEAEYKLHLKG